MPTDAERYAQLLQNLSVGIGAIRDAAELAFGVMLPSAETLNEEFDGIAKRRGLHWLEGLWTNEQRPESLYCARVVDGDLLVPYSHHSRDQLDSHFHELGRFGDTIVGRFSWFNQPIGGYLSLEVVSHDRLVGQWWYGEDFPGGLEPNPSVLKSASTTGWSISLKRIKPPTTLPPWVEDYFANPKQRAFRRRPPAPPDLGRLG